MSSGRYSQGKFYGIMGGSTCGYCKKTPNASNRGMKTIGMETPRLTCQDYLDLIDRGWRRSGTYCYRPVMQETCCPMYTIRCDTANFVLSASHKRLLKRIQRYVVHNERPKSSTSSSSSAKGYSKGSKAKVAVAPAFYDKDKKNQSQSKINGSSTDNSSQNVGSAGDIASKRPSKAKSKRWTRKLEKLQSLAEQNQKPFDEMLQEYQNRRTKRLDKTKPKTLEELLEPLTQASAKHRLQVRLVRSHPESSQFKETVGQEFEVYRKYQVAIHGDSPASLHLDGFRRFLVDSPLLGVSFKQTLKDSAWCDAGLGSFHMQYWLDDKLIAVGVVDLLPVCLSSVYLFYDPDYQFLQLGTFTALQEIAMIRSLAHEIPNFGFYYLGFYIHSCVKMRYKRQFHPSYLACPETYRFIPMSICRPKLDAAKYARLDEDTSAKDAQSFETDADLDPVVVLNVRSQTLSYSQLKALTRGEPLDLVQEFATAVGLKCAERMILLT